MRKRLKEMGRLRLKQVRTKLVVFLIFVGLLFALDFLIGDKYPVVYKAMSILIWVVFFYLLVRYFVDVRNLFGLLKTKKKRVH
jgi:hypothetical protein